MVTARAEAKAEPFVLESLDTTLIPSANRADGTASTWSTIWKFQVPNGQKMVLGPDDYFSTYLEDASAEVGNNTCRVRIRVTDTSESDVKTPVTPVLYVNVKEFQDRRKKFRLRVPTPVEVPENYFILVEVYDDGAIDESDSAFELSMTRIRQGLA